MARQASPSRRPQQRAPVDVTAVLMVWSAWLLRVAVVVLILAYGYYVWAVVGGYLSHPVDARILGNLRLMGSALVLAGAVGTAALIVLTFDEVAWAVLAGLVGGWLVFGTPVLIASYARGGQNASVQIVGKYSALAGEVMLALVVLRVLYEIVLYLRLAPVRRKEEAEEKPVRKAAPLLAKLWACCWQMPYCHEAVRELCPAYRARKTCWKFGYGCMCHPRLIEALIRASTQGATAAARARQAEYVRSDLEADLAVTPTQRTIPCVKCAIYVEHQRQKFRLVNPVVALATIVALILGYKPLMGLYAAFIAMLSDLAARFTLTDQVDPRQWFVYLDSPAVRVFFYIIFGTLLLAYVLRAVEWLVLVRKVV
jgi:hypothetical protein